MSRHARVVLETAWIVRFWQARRHGFRAARIVRQQRHAEKIFTFTGAHALHKP